MKAIKIVLGISILLNVILVGCLLALILNEPPVPVESTLEGISEPDSAESPQARSLPFHWSQMVSTNDYRAYVANLRGIGCPEETIREIVKGDVERAFSAKRRELWVSESGAGQWSKQAEAGMVDELVSSPQAGGFAQSPGAETGNEALKAILPGGPMLVASASSARGRTGGSERGTSATQSAAALSENLVARANSGSKGNQPAHQQSVLDPGSTSRASNEPISQTLSPTTQTPALAGGAAEGQGESTDDALRAALGNQGYLAYQYGRYYSNFEVILLESGGGPVTINPDELSR